LSAFDLSLSPHKAMGILVPCIVPGRDAHF
jgi:hypothetical protein